MSTDRTRWTPALPPNAVVGRSKQWMALKTIMSDNGLSPGTKNIAWALANHLNGESGWTFTSLATLAAAVGMRRADAQRHLAALEGGQRPVDDRHAPKRTATYICSRRFGQDRAQTVYRCLIEPQWVSEQCRDTHTVSATQIAV